MNFSHIKIKGLVEVVISESSVVTETIGEKIHLQKATHPTLFGHQCKHCSNNHMKVPVSFHWTTTAWTTA